MAELAEWDPMLELRALEVDTRNVKIYISGKSGIHKLVRELEQSE